jgi:hypothetical protein
MSNFVKIRSAVLELLHTDRQTDMVKLIGAFFKRAYGPVKLPRGWTRPNPVDPERVNKEMNFLKIIDLY